MCIQSHDPLREVVKDISNYNVGNKDILENWPFIATLNVFMKEILSCIQNQNHKSHDANEAKWLRVIRQ
jgi:hypothetical protein